MLCVTPTSDQNFMICCAASGDKFQGQMALMLSAMILLDE
jgi:hypothetical protein